MRMLTRSSGRDYEHPLIHIPETSMRLDFGWWSVFSTSLRTQRLEL